MSHAAWDALLRPFLLLLFFGVAAAIAYALLPLLRRILPPRVVEFLFRRR